VHLIQYNSFASAYKRMAPWD